MIITAVSHGRSIGDSHRLGKHLSKTDGQTVRIVASNDIHEPVDLADALDDVRRYLATNKRAVIGFQHITLNPTTQITDRQARVAVEMIKHELNAKYSPWILVEHRKPRATINESVHYHLVIAQVGSDGRGVDVRDSYARLEAIARILETTWGEELTVGRRTARVAQILRRMGHTDVAERLLEASGKRDKPRSSMTTKTRARADREGIALPRLRQIVSDAWSKSDPISTLEKLGLTVARGEKQHVWLVTTPDGHLVGSVDRLVHAPRHDVDIRMKSLVTNRPTSDATDIPNSERIEDGNKRRTFDDRARTGAEGRNSADPTSVGRDAGDRGADPRHSFLDRGRNGSGDLAAVGGESRRGAHDAHCTDAARALAQRRARTLIEVRRAEHARRGRRRAFDASGYKARLWREIFGDDIDEDLLSTLIHIDASTRFVRTASGWIRDAGDVLYASSADPHVVAVMVAAALAKGWTHVEIWGDADFLREARTQLEAAGIVVSIRGEPYITRIPDDSRPPTPKGHDLKKDLRRLEEQFADLEKPLQPSDFQIEIGNRLAELYEKHRELTLVFQDPDSKERSKDSFLKRFTRRLFEVPLSSSDETDRQRDSSDRLHSEIQFYEQQLRNHKERREVERFKKLHEVGRAIGELRERISESRLTGQAVADDPSLTDPVVPG